VSLFSYITFTGNRHSSLDSFNRQERYTSCGFVVAIPKRMPNLGAETRALYIQKLYTHGGRAFKFCRFHEGGPLPLPLACSTPLPAKATKLRSCTSVCVQLPQLMVQQGGGAKPERRSCIFLTEHRLGWLSRLVTRRRADIC